MDAQDADIAENKRFGKTLDGFEHPPTHSPFRTQRRKFDLIGSFHFYGDFLIVCFGFLVGIQLFESETSPTK